MKLRTNFINTPINLVPGFSIVTWGLALGLLALSIYLVFDGQRLQKNNIVLLDQKKIINDKWISINDGNKQQLTKERFNQLKIRLATINQLTEMTGQDILSILSQLENLMSDQSYLLSLNYRSNTDELTLIIESSDVEKLTNFIDSLEKDKMFGDITIVHQNHVSNKDQAAVQFEVHVKSLNNRKGI